MATEYKLSYTAADINKKLGKIDNLDAAVLYNAQTLTDAQKAQVRKNIGAVTLEEVVSALPTWTGGSY